MPKRDATLYRCDSCGAEVFSVNAEAPKVSPLEAMMGAGQPPPGSVLPEGWIELGVRHTVLVVDADSGESLSGLKSESGLVACGASCLLRILSARFDGIPIGTLDSFTSTSNVDGGKVEPGESGRPRRKR